MQMIADLQSQRPARILQVCNSDFFLSNFLGALVTALAGRGHEVHVATEGDRVPAELLRCCRVHQVQFPKSASPRRFHATIRQLRRIIRAEGIDCVNSHNRNASITGRLAAWLERVPVNVYTAHGFYFHDDQNRLGRLGTVALEAGLARITDHVLSQSGEDTRFMTARRLIRRNAIETVWNGIDDRKFPAPGSRSGIEARLGLSPSTFRIASVGRIVGGKGFGDLVTAFARFLSTAPGRGHCELLIIGGNIATDIDPAATQVAGLIERIGLADRVRVTGLVDNVAEYLRCCDAYVSCSYREGLSRALLEAMCSGLPVIATRIRGAREIVVDGENGLLFEPRDSAACAEAMGVLCRDPALRAEMGRRNRAVVLSKFTETAYTERQVRAIERLLRQGRRRQQGMAGAAPGVPS